MKYWKIGKTAAAAVGLLLCLGLVPMRASAGGGNNVLQKGGIAALLENRLSAEEYLEAAWQAETASWGYTNIGVACVEGDHLNVRETPGVEGGLVGQMPDQAVCEVLEILEGWAHIRSGAVEGYVSLDFLLTGAEARVKARELVRTRVTVKADVLNVRSGPGTDCAVLTTVRRGSVLEYLEMLDGWVRVSVEGKEAYVSAECVTVEDQFSTALTMTEVKYGVGVTDVRADLVEYAKQFLGNPYVWGGTSLTRGADCSGFVLSIFKKYGYSLPHYSGSQANCGTKISFSEIKPGDLVFYNGDNGIIGHVGIYIGNEQIIHASSPSSGIKISTYNYRKPARYVRILED